MFTYRSAREADFWSWLPGRASYYRRQAALKLDKAADLLEDPEQPEWGQGDFVTFDKKVCALGAIQVVCGAKIKETTVGSFRSFKLVESAVDNPLFLAAAAEMGNCVEASGQKTRTHQSSIQTVAGWNDRSGRTKAEVVAMMRGCAQRLRGKSNAKLTPTEAAE